MEVKMYLSLASGHESTRSGSGLKGTHCTGNQTCVDKCRASPRRLFMATGDDEQHGWLVSDVNRS